MTDFGDVPLSCADTLLSGITIIAIKTIVRKIITMPIMFTTNTTYVHLNHAIYNYRSRNSTIQFDL